MLGLRALRFWRSFKSFGGAVTTVVAAVGERAAATQTHAVEASERVERLTAATARLQESLARMTVLLAAANDVRETVTGLRGAVPRK